MDDERIFAGVARKKAKRAKLIIDLVAKEFGSELEDIYTRSRANKYSLPRSVAMSLIRTALKLEWSVISKHFGYKSHAGPINTIRLLEYKLNRDDDLKDSIVQILKRYNEEK